MNAPIPCTCEACRRSEIAAGAPVPIQRETAQEMARRNYAERRNGAVATGAVVGSDVSDQPTKPAGVYGASQRVSEGGSGLFESSDGFVPIADAMAHDPVSESLKQYAAQFRPLVEHTAPDGTHFFAHGNIRTRADRNYGQVLRDAMDAAKARVEERTVEEGRDYCKMHGRWLPCRDCTAEDVAETKVWLDAIANAKQEQATNLGDAPMFGQSKVAEMQTSQRKVNAELRALLDGMSIPTTSEADLTPEERAAHLTKRVDYALSIVDRGVATISRLEATIDRLERLVDEREDQLAHTAAELARVQRERASDVDRLTRQIRAWQEDSESWVERCDRAERHCRHWRERYEATIAAIVGFPVPNMEERT